jgi:hypothetical protein
MGALLKKLAASVNPMKLELLVNDRRADLLSERLRGMPASLKRFDMQFAFAKELLNAGRNEDALKALEALEHDAVAFSPTAWQSNRTIVLLQRAQAYMRIAEEQNCHQANNRESCLMPIRGQGIHRKKEGGQRAIQVLLQILETEPDNLRARWLLNVAHMTLGTHPQGVPVRHLIPAKAFASEYPLPRFDNVARESGIDLYGLAGGAVLDDFDGDQDLDLVVSFQGLADPMRYFRNRGDGTFEDRTDASGLAGQVGGLNMIHGDYDNDGRPDVVVLRGGWMGSEGNFPLSLLHNEGGGAFRDRTGAAGLLRFAPTQAAVLFDYDNDGWLDLFVGNEATAGNAQPCQLFHNNQDGTFTEAAAAAGVDFLGWVKGVAAGDYDNDGRTDLYLSMQGENNVLFKNEGPKDAKGSWRSVRFRDVTAAARVGEPRDSFGTFFFDYDNDGWLDLFVVGYSQTGAEDIAADYLGLPTRVDRGRLYRNLGNGTFEDVTKAAGLYKVVLAMGHNFGDLDNDGWLDIYFGTGKPDFSLLIPNRMFRNAGGKTFQDVTTAGNFGHLQKGHGVAFGDVDGDGDQDVFEQMGGAYLSDKAYSTLYRNPGNTNGWIGLSLVGARTNRSAVGARIKLTVQTPKGPRTIHRTVSEGGSFGASPFRQHIGVGRATAASAIEVFWPASGQIQKLGGLPLGSWHEIREGEAKTRTLSVALPARSATIGN